MESRVYHFVFISFSWKFEEKIAEIEWTCEKLYMFINVNVDVLKDSLACHGVRVQ